MLLPSWPEMLRLLLQHRVLFLGSESMTCEYVSSESCVEQDAHRSEALLEDASIFRCIWIILQGRKLRKVLVDTAPLDGYVCQLFQMITSMTWIWKRTVLRLSVIQRMVMLC
jgi:hypothetical protein